MDPKISVLLGTKAEMIKIAPVLKELEKRGLAYRLIETGQHGAYLDRLRKEFNIREPDVRLGKKKMWTLFLKHANGSADWSR